LTEIKSKMSAQKKKSSGCGSTLKGDCEPGLNPLIPFVPLKVDEGDEPPTVDITIKKNTKKKPTKVNTKKKTFSVIETFTGSGAFIVMVLKKLQMEIFEHLGISNAPKKVDDQLDYLLQVTTAGHARDQLVRIFKQGRQQFASIFAVTEQQRDVFVQDKGVFFEWLLNGDKDDAPKETLENLGTTANEYCQQYKSYVWFKMGKLMWARHQTVHDEHIRYFKNKIIKPYDMAIRDFYNRVIKMYSFLYHLQPPLMNNQAWYQAKWHMLTALPSEECIHVPIRNDLPRSMQDKLDQRD
jgi:hypothetical protein